MHATASVAALAIRNVLAATDFSSCSQRALMHAIAAAHRLGSILHVVHVVQPSRFSIAPPEGYIACGELANYAQDLGRLDAERQLKDVLSRTRCEDLEYHIWVEQGDVGEKVREIINREHIDLAIVGTHGKSGMTKIFMGSVAEDVFRNASCPVLTVGPHSWRSDPLSVHLERILFPTDLSEDSARALPFAVASANEFGAAFTMLNVVKEHCADTTDARSRIAESLRQRMRQMISSLQPLPSTLNFEVQFGDVAQCVIDASASMKADLIVFGLKAPDTFSDHLPWMHAYKVVCEVGCPVLTIRGLRHKD